MTYPDPFHRLVIIGTIYNDVWNTSLSIIPRAGSGTIGLDQVEASDLTAIASIVSAWFAPDMPTGVGFPSNVKLTGIKLNRINETGHYADPVSREHTYPSPISGGGGAVNVAAQLALAATLRTAVPRGRGSKGRMFLPQPAALTQSQLGADGRLTTANATTVANAVRTLIVNINAAYGTMQSGDEQLGRVGVASNAGEGIFREVTQVSVGRVPDTIRSRRSKLIEDAQFSTTIP